MVSLEAKARKVNDGAIGKANKAAFVHVEKLVNELVGKMAMKAVFFQKITWLVRRSSFYCLFYCCGRSTGSLGDWTVVGWANGANEHWSFSSVKLHVRFRPRSTGVSL